MWHAIVTALLWFAVIGCGLVAGLYFAFSAFVMAALSRIDQAAGIAAMNAINAAILRSLFMPLFFGTSIASLALAVIGLLRWGEAGTTAMSCGGVIYFAGMFVVTMAFNVPLNTALAAVDPASPPAAVMWARYLKDWTFWNHVRTVASTVACALFVAALVAGDNGNGQVPIQAIAVAAAAPLR